MEAYHSIRSGATLVIGTRSSLLLPFQNLGLIIVDEETDKSYKQHQPAPRYHGRDSAVYLAHLMNCRVILGSSDAPNKLHYLSLFGASDELPGDPGFCNTFYGISA